MNKSLRDGLLILAGGVLLSALPLIYPGQVYILTIYGIRTPLRVEYLGWFGVVAGIVMVTTYFLKPKKTEEEKTVKP